MPDEDKKTNKTIASIVVALLGFLTTITSTMYLDRQKLEERVYQLELLNKQEQDLRHKTELARLSLQYELSKSFKIIDVIEAFIDEMPFPAWIKKRLDNGDFEMLIINRAYEIAFDITKAQYEGKKDKDLWPENLAEKYKELDEKVYNSKRSRCEIEPTIRNEKETEDLTCKFPLRLKDEKFGVGGVIVTGE